MNNKNKNKTNTNNNSTTKLRLGILAISVIAVFMISPSVMQYAYAADGPIITSLVADDPDDLDDIYSIDDTITITFDSDTNEPGGTGIQSGAALNDLFTFTESIGQGYIGQWNTPDTFTITIKNVNNATLIIGTTTVTPAGTTPILSDDETSDASSDTSPVLSGDFGVLAFPNPWMDGNAGVIHYDGGNVGIGTTIPNNLLSVNGIIESTSGGFKFPDGNMQTIAGITIESDPVFDSSVTSSISQTDIDNWNDDQVDDADSDPANEIETWSTLSGIPADIADGDDIGVNLWTQSGSDIYYTSGNVGIGTTNPTAKLHVQGVAKIDSDGVDPNNRYLSLSSYGSDGVIRVNPGPDSTIYVNREVGTPRNFYVMDGNLNVLLSTISTSGYVGIGTANPSQKLDVNGNSISNSWSTHSSQKWKKDITPLDNTLDKITQIQGVTYQWRADEFPEMSFDETATQIGFIAEELEMIYPELVYTTENGDKSIDYSKLTPILLEAIKEQQNSIEEQQDMINTQQEKFADQQDMINIQQDILEQLKTVICPEHPELSACP